MSDSGFSGLPPGTRGGDISFPQSRAELRAKIIEIRGEIKVQRVRTKLEGDIIRHNEDGTTRIRTEKGELTVQLRGREIPPEGAKIEIEIPAGNPAGQVPRQVIVRAAPQSPPQQQSAPQTRTEITTPVTTEITRDITQRPTEPLPKTPPPLELKPDTIIRLTPLLPQQQAQLLIPPALGAIETRVTALPPQIQALLENTLPRILFEQTAQLVSIAAEEIQPIRSGEQAKTVQTSPLFSSSTQISDQISGLLVPSLVLRHDVPRNDEVQITKLPLQQLSALSITLPPETVLPQNPFTILTPANKAQSFNVNIQTIAPPQVRLTTIPAQPLNTETTIPTLQSAPIIQQHHAGSITATVTGVTPQNLPVLSIFTTGTIGVAPETALNFVMPFQAGNIPLGTQIQMTPQAGRPASFQATATITAATPTAPFVPLEFFSNISWPAMEELNQALGQISAKSAQAFSNITANASTPARLPAAALFFIAAVRSGDISSWLGDKNIDALRRAGKGDLLSRLTRDISGLQRTATEPLSQDWRGTALPIMAEGDIHKMMLYYRHDDDGEQNNEDTRRGTRFIFDLSLNRLGAVQIDGLHRPGRLNLIVRTHSALSQPMQQNMRRTYIEALEQTELTGELSFQNKPEQFIKVELPKEDVAVSV